MGIAGVLVWSYASLGFSGRRRRVSVRRSGIWSSRSSNEARIEQELFYELRGAWREFNTGQKRLEVAEVAVNLQEEQFAQEEARYAAGLATLREVLEAQEDMDTAQASYLEAWIDALQARVVISRLDGSLLERHELFGRTSGK